jgi:N-acetylglucosaminyldiphosphoundecaprenol N-acetyl-beta-D-mannosaminyltransferase
MAAAVDRKLQAVLSASGEWKLEMTTNLRHPVAVLGLPLDNLTGDAAVEAVEALMLSGGTDQVATADLDFWLKSISDPHLHRIVAGCSLVLPDGMPLVWASGLLGCPLAERVTGVDLVPRMAELSARKGYKICLLAGKAGVAERVCKMLERTYPGARVYAIHAAGEEDPSQLNSSEILSRVHAVKPDVLFVAFGNHKQEKWIWTHRKRLGVPVTMGVGETFETLAGDMRRAPLWAQRGGFEWLIRCMQEPSRLIPRYLRDLLGLGRRLPMALLAAWFQRPYLGPSKVTTASTQEVLHIYLHGKLSAAIAQPLQEATEAAIAGGRVAVMHLQGVRQVSAAGLGLLLEARRQLLEAGLTLSLAGLNLKLRFLLYAWCVQTLFDEWQPVNAQRRARPRGALAVTCVTLGAEQAALTIDPRIRG